MIAQNVIQKYPNYNSELSTIMVYASF